MEKLEILDIQNKYKDILLKLTNKYNKIKYIASVSSLKINSEIISFFYDSIDKDYSKEELCLRLYGFFQALFVSIDSIYSLSMALTKSKNFLKINDNKVLREVKYIRNDVVGHPTNRIVSRNVVYCILDPKDIEKYKFKYSIYFQGEKRIREVSFLDVLYNYYTESFKILSVLHGYEEVRSTHLLTDDVYYMINLYLKGENIGSYLKQIKKDFIKYYNYKTSRINKKIDLLYKLHSLPRTKLNQFTYLYHIVKLYEAFCILENQTPKTIKITPYPLEIKQIKKFFCCNSDHLGLLDILLNHDNPEFKKALDEIIIICKKSSIKYARLFFEEIRYRISKSMFDEAYALEGLLKLI